MLCKENSQMITKKYINPESEQYFAFNIWSIESAKAVIDGASKIGKNVILQTSVKSFQMLDKEEIRSFITGYMNKKNVRVYLHLDHCKDLKYIKEAMEYGWDSVMIDASTMSLEDNIEITNTACEMAKKYGVLVEAEIGQIFKCRDDIDDTEEKIAKIEDIEIFVRNSEIDILAAAVGTAHGLYRSTPKIHYDLIEKISKFTSLPLAIHGGTGLTDEMLLKLLSYKNVKKINISTNVKMAYRYGIIESIQRGYMDMDGFDPLKVVGQIHDSLERMTMNKLKLLKKE